jgi:glycine/D-amino acid oxidase-like deaminating enzyme/nitrite reductase/ring-hydroxylating ferredoxin subunit
MKRDGALNSLWQDTTATYHKDAIVPYRQIFDVIIAGAGITGITTGLLLQKAGRSVLIAEAKSPGFGTTGGTTAHLNTFFDTPYNVIQSKFGDKNAQLVAKAAAQALQLIKQNVEEYGIDCSYKELPAYLFSQNEKQTRELEDIFRAAQEVKVDCSWSSKIPVPISFEKAVCFAGNATFHPTRYLMALRQEFEKAGGILLEDCRITGIEETEPATIHSSLGDLRARHFIYATHIPPGVNLLHFRCAPYRSYAMAVQLEKKKDYPDALIYDMYDPYHYYRTQEIDGEQYFIAGGEDHKTGHEQNTETCFRKLEAHINKYFPVKAVVNQWSSQYFEPADGLPYIGHLPGHPGSMYVATGYGGNGMIYSGVAAISLTGMITSGKSAYEELFDPNRIKPVAGFSNFIKEAADVVGTLIGKLVLPHDKLEELAGLANGEAAVVKYEGQRLAIYKDEHGEIYALNSACTHIKCEVAWNSAEKTWDCPCHGSRFNYTGEMLTAPARKDLDTVEIMIEANA